MSKIATIQMSIYKIEHFAIFTYFAQKSYQYGSALCLSLSCKIVGAITEFVAQMYLQLAQGYFVTVSCGKTLLPLKPYIGIP